MSEVHEPTRRATLPLKHRRIHIHKDEWGRHRVLKEFSITHHTGLCCMHLPGRGRLLLFLLFFSKALYTSEARAALFIHVSLPRLQPVAAKRLEASFFFSFYTYNKLSIIDVCQISNSALKICIKSGSERTYLCRIHVQDPIHLGLQKSVQSQPINSKIT